MSVSKPAPIRRTPIWPRRRAPVPRLTPSCFRRADCRFGMASDRTRGYFDEIPRNKITAMIGPWAYGKSTLLRCFNRMNDLIVGSRMNGDIRFDGELISSSDIDAVVLRRRIGMVFQKPNPFPKTIYNNVAWGARINGYRGDINELVERSLRRAALWTK